MAKVLVVDDSASMRQMVAFTLKQAGHEVVEGRDGKDGLSKAQGAKADLVITDVNMPTMDGLQLTRELRKLGDYKFTPILVLTTEAGPEKKQEGKAAGATGWLVKPFDPDQLMNTVNRVLR
ncbi:response regulator [Thioalkalivibrio sp. AKL19]|uniref:response regulator n=1 Tax=unclassified Thioalkalivibrio TaxID=2621013 RepID=UPI0004243A20|nr:response regulator [Thioalkalivibrio sp. AKL19]